MSPAHDLVHDLIERVRQRYPDGEICPEIAAQCAIHLAEQCCDTPPELLEALHAQLAAARVNARLAKVISEQNKAAATKKAIADRKAAASAQRKTEIESHRLLAQVSAAKEEERRLRVAEARAKEPSLEALNRQRVADGKVPWLF